MENNKVIIYGPFGSAFSNFMNQEYAIVIGGGTGITSGLSVLKEKIYEIYQNINSPNNSIP